MAINVLTWLRLPPPFFLTVCSRMYLDTFIDTYTPARMNGHTYERWFMVGDIHQARDGLRRLRVSLISSLLGAYFVG